MRALSLTLFLLIVATLTGCIESDDSYSFYLYPDGKVDMIMFKDNVRSSSSDKDGVKAEKDWLSDFKAGKLWELDNLKKTKAKNIQAVLLRKTAPYSVVVRGSYPSVAAFGTFFDIGSKDSSATINFYAKGTKRDLLIHVSGKTSDKASKVDASKEVSQNDLPLPVWKFIPVGGRITNDLLCTPSKDKSLCVIDIAGVNLADKLGKPYDLSIEWDTAL